MNQLTIYTLKALRKAYAKLFNVQPLPKPACEQNPDVVSQLIYEALTSDKPCMIARFGSTELSCLMNYIGVHVEKKQVFNYITGKTNPWWWDKNIMNQMQQWSGFFPPTVEKIEQFCELMLNDIKEVDILGSWQQSESYFDEELKNVQKVNFELLNPYFSVEPWTKALKGEKVLVIHPFEQTIISQYQKRKLLFENPNILPDFELKTIKAVQSLAGEKTKYKDWFEALDYMKSEIDKVDYNICLIGAGAYGLPLAAYVKRQGKKAVHLGGSLQLLFGIKGKRWDGQYNDKYNYSQFYNKYWVRVSENEKPKNADIVEGACYW